MRNATHKPTPRRYATVAATTVATLALASCGGFVNTEDPDEADGTGGGGESGSLNAYVSTEQSTGLEPLVAPFEEESGISLDLSSAEVADMNQQLAVQLGSGTAADILRVSPGYSSNVAAGVLGNDGALMDLSEEPWVPDIDSGTRALSTVDGNTYAFPIARNSLVMAYNTNVFDELGLEPPTTWSELLELCQTVEDAGRTAIAQGLAGGAIYLQFYVYVLAGTLLYGPEPDLNERMLADEVNFADHPGWTEVFTKYLELRDRGFFTEEALGVPPEQAMQDLATGDAAMMLLTNSSLPQVHDYASNGAEDIAVFAMPANDDPEATLMPTAPDFLAVNADADNPEGARAFLEFLSQPENVENYANTLAVLPGLDVGAEVSNEALDPVMPLVDNSRTVPYANYLWPNGDVQQTMLQSGQQLYADEIAVDQLLQQMDEQYDLGTP